MSVQFEIWIRTNNAAFDDDRNVEVARILRDVASKLDDDLSAGNVRDYNGNEVGSYGFVQQDERERVVADD